MATESRLVLSHVVGEIGSSNFRITELKPIKDSRPEEAIQIKTQLSWRLG
jgi:hypothetical protein